MNTPLRTMEGFDFYPFESVGEVKAFRRKHRIYVQTLKQKKAVQHLLEKGDPAGRQRKRNGEEEAVVAICAQEQLQTPPPIRNFDDLKELHTHLRDVQNGETETIHGESAVSVPPIHDWLCESLTKNLGYSVPTPVQMQAIPVLLRGQNLLACAPTGSGKTVAFLLPLLCRLQSPGRTFARILVICPSRELAQQTKREFDKLIGKKKYRSRLLDKLVGEEHNIRRLDLAVSTPLKLIQLCRSCQVTLKDCEYLVLDEADRLLDAGFAGQIDEILSFCSRYASGKLQMCLISATLPENVIQLAESIMHSDTIRLQVGASNAACTTIHQSLMFVTKEEGKLLAFRQLVREGKLVPPTLVFVQSKERAQQLFNELVYDGIFVDVIHAERTKAQRDALVEAFRAQKVWVLICTDLMARGVDFKGVKMVINYDFPQSGTAYIHRIGRTGRAGMSGKAITFFSIDDLPYLRLIVNVMRQSGCEVPDWMIKIAKPDKRDVKRFAITGLKRKRISTTSGWDLSKKHRKQHAIKRSKETKGVSTK